MEGNPFIVPVGIKRSQSFTPPTIDIGKFSKYKPVYDCFTFFVGDCLNRARAFTQLKMLNFHGQKAQVTETKIVGYPRRLYVAGHWRPRITELPSCPGTGETVAQNDIARKSIFPVHFFMFKS